MAVIPPAFRVTDRMAWIFNLAAFKRIVSVAALAGVLAGLLLTGVQQIQMSPIILKAEVYEDAATAAAAAQAAHVHSAAESHEHHEHEHHEHECAWQPANGGERTFLLLRLANISLAVGFGLLLGSCHCLRGDSKRLAFRTVVGVGGVRGLFRCPFLGFASGSPWHRSGSTD